MIVDAMKCEIERLAPLAQSDQAELAVLFEACFSSQPDSHWYAWKYQSDKRFDGIALGMWRDTSLVAHYAGFPRTLVCGKKKLLALQVGDVMVHPDARHGLAKFNRFAKITKGFFSKTLRLFDAHNDRPLEQVGVQVHGIYDVAYGFPNARHLRQGAIQACYRPADLMFEIGWKIGQKARISTNDEKELLVEWISDDDRDFLCLDPMAFNDIAIEMVKSFASKDVWAVSRSLAYWLWRFPRHRSYRWVLVRENHNPISLVAAAIVKPSQGGETYELLDWICRPGRQSGAFNALLKSLELEHVLSLRTWASKSALRYFQSDLLDRVETLPFQMALSVYPDARAADLLANRLWMISGDTDFR